MLRMIPRTKNFFHLLAIDRDTEHLSTLHIRLSDLPCAPSGFRFLLHPRSMRLAGW